MEYEVTINFARPGCPGAKIRYMVNEEQAAALFSLLLKVDDADQLIDRLNRESSGAGGSQDIDPRRA